LEHGVPGSTAQFNIIAYDKNAVRRVTGGDLFHIHFEKDWKPYLHYEIKDNDDGSYTETYHVPPQGQGEMLIHVTERDGHIQGSPFHVFIGRVSADKTTAEGEGLQHATLGQVAEFRIFTRDRFGEMFPNNEAIHIEIKDEEHLDDEKFDAPATCLDHHDGSYAIQYTVPLDSKTPRMQVSIQLGQKHIKGSPFHVSVDAPLRFGQCSNLLVLTNNNRTVTNTVNHHFALGAEAYTKGTHSWSVHIDKLENNNWIFIGIANDIPNTSNSFQSSCAYGIASMNQLYEAGKISYPNYITPYQPYFLEGDTIFCTLDCDANALIIREGSRGTINHRVLVPPNKSWYPHVNLRGRNDQVTLR